MPASQIARPRGIDLVFHCHECGRNCLARAEVLKAASICSKTSLINPELLLLRLAETVGALDMGEVAAVLRMHFADDEIAFLDLPHRRHSERMRIGIAIAIP